MGWADKIPTSEKRLDWSRRCQRGWGLTDRINATHIPLSLLTLDDLDAIQRVRAPYNGSVPSNKEMDYVEELLSRIGGSDESTRE